MPERVPLVVSGDLDAIAEGRMRRSAGHDLSRNPVVTVLPGTLGTSDGGWASEFRGVGPLPPAHLEMDETVRPIDENGFGLVDLTPDAATLRYFSWNQKTQPVEAIDALGSFHTTELKRGWPALQPAPPRPSPPRIAARAVPITMCSSDASSHPVDRPAETGPEPEPRERSERAAVRGGAGAGCRRPRSGAPYACSRDANSALVPKCHGPVATPIASRVTFHNAETGFCVLRVKVRGQRDLATVVGHAALVSAGEFVSASGVWVNDRTHGLQFRASFL
jgi:hypothetical protein